MDEKLSAAVYSQNRYLGNSSSENFKTGNTKMFFGILCRLLAFYVSELHLLLTDVSLETWEWIMLYFIDGLKDILIKINKEGKRIRWHMAKCSASQFSNCSQSNCHWVTSYVLALPIFVPPVTVRRRSQSKFAWPWLWPLEWAKDKFIYSIRKPINDFLCWM